MILIICPAHLPPKRVLPSEPCRLVTRTVKRRVCCARQSSSYFTTKAWYVLEESRSLLHIWGVFSVCVRYPSLRLGAQGLFCFIESMLGSYQYRENGVARTNTPTAFILPFSIKPLFYLRCHYQATVICNHERAEAEKQFHYCTGYRHFPRVASVIAAVVSDGPARVGRAPAKRYCVLAY